MAINYRVDRSIDPLRVPCGMNSIVHIGPNWAEAYKAYRETGVGIDPWNKESPVHGVILSVWDDAKNDYTVKCSKGFAC